LTSNGDEVKVLLIEHDGSKELLEKYGIEYKLIYGNTGKNYFDKALIFVYTTIRYYIEALKFKPDIIIGRGTPMLAICSKLLKIPHIIFEDTEISKISLYFCKKYTSLIITPRMFKTDLGTNHIRVDAYKESFYLNSKNFKPDPNIKFLLGVGEKEEYFLLRLIRWNASHDFGQHGLSKIGIAKIISTLEQYGKVFISYEGEIPEEYKKYKLNIDITEIHSVLNYSKLFISESGTMTTEAALLGVPTIMISTLANKLGNFIELRDKYKVIDTYEDEDNAIQRLEEVVCDDNYYKIIKNNHKLMMGKLIDISSFYLSKIKGN